MENPINQKIEKQREEDLIFKFICFFVIILTVIVFYPLTQTGFTTNDDLLTAIGNFGGGWLSSAKAQGRIGFIVSGPIAELPYVIDSNLYYQTIRLGSIVFNIFLLGYVIYVLYKCKWISILCVLLSIAFMQNAWGHSIITSYPFNFQFGITLFLFSIISFIWHLEKGGTFAKIITPTLYFFALMFSEIFVLYFLVYIAIAFAFSDHEIKIQDKLLRITQKLFPLIASLFLFLFLYFGFRIMFPSGYEGNTAGGSISQALTVIWQYSIASLPAYFTLSNKGAGAYQSLIFTFASDGFTLKTLFYDMRVDWIIKSIIVFFSCYLIFMRLNLRYSYKNYILSLAIVCLLFFLPNLLVSLTAKYQLWVAHGDISYVYTFFSFLASTIFLSLLSVLVIAVINKLTRIAWISILPFALLASFLSLLTDFHNYYVTNNQILSQDRWRIINQFVESNEFNDIPAESIIYAPSLLKTKGFGLILGDLDAYVKKKNGKLVYFVRDKEEYDIRSGNRLDVKLYYVAYRQEEFYRNQYLLFSEIKEFHSLRPVSENAIIFSHSRNNNINVFGNTIAQNGKRPVYLNSIPMVERRGNQFLASYSVNKSSINGGVSIFRLKSQDELDLESIFISYLYPSPIITRSANSQIDFRNVNLPSVISDIMGISPNEDWGAWSNGSVVKIRFREPLPLHFNLYVTGGAWEQNINNDIIFSIGDSEKSIRFNGNPFSGANTISMDFNLTKADDTITIKVPYPFDDGSGRLIGIGLINLMIEERF